MRHRLACLSVLALAVTGCGGSSTPAASSDSPYRVSFVNDTAQPVQVVGCPDCGSGHALAAGATWDTSMTGGAEDVTFEGNGSKVGCVHFVNGLVPAEGAPATVIKVSANSPCRA